MKKMIALMTALLMLLGCAAWAEGSWVKDSVENGEIWVSDRAILEVFVEDEDNYKVMISWASSAWECTEWVFRCDYDAQADSLRAVSAVCDNVLYSEDGSDTRTNVYERDSQAVFALNEKGGIVCRDTGDESLEGLVFEYAAETEESGEEAALWPAPESLEVTQEALAVYQKAMEGLTGVSYEPVAVVAQQEGVYCVLCRAAVVYPGAQPYYALVYAGENGLENIWAFPRGEGLETAPAAEDGWTLPESAGLSGEVRAVYEQAMTGLLGVDYAPQAFLGEKDGVYCVLCRAQVVYPGAVPYAALVFVSSDGVQNIVDVPAAAHVTDEEPA